MHIVDKTQNKSGTNVKLVYCECDLDRRVTYTE